MIRRLAGIDPRVLRLALVALPAMLALVGWGQVLRPAWQAREAAVALRESTRHKLLDLPIRREKAEALGQEATALDRQLDAPETAPTRLPALLESLATHHGVELMPVFPGRNTEFDGLVETRYEIGASGSYPRLVAWLADLETYLEELELAETAKALPQLPHKE